MPDSLIYPIDTLPQPGHAIELAPGLHWVRLPLPIKLNHINVWLLDGGDEGWTVIDTGSYGDDLIAQWEDTFANVLGGRPITRLICTHFHPDHIGLADWFTQRWGVELETTRTEYFYARQFSLDLTDRTLDEIRTYYTRAGADPDLVEKQLEHGHGYTRGVPSVPPRYTRIQDGETLRIGGRDWRVMIGRGHAPEQITLYCAELNILLSADQVLPRISPNVSVWLTEPNANPLLDFITTLKPYKELPADAFVLPCHNEPFTGLHERIDWLLDHHDERLNHALDDCGDWNTAREVARTMFGHRELDAQQWGFAMGEAIAHLNYLIHNGDLVRELRDGVNWYRRA